MVSTELSDQVLVLQVQEGDADAFGVLYSRYLGFVKGVVGRKVHSNDVDDVTQEVFIRVFERLGSLKNPYRFRAWVATIARSMIIDRYRLKGVSLFCTDRIDQCVVVSPQDHIEASERVDELFSALLCLTSMYREPVEAYYFAGRSIQQIAEAFKVNPGAIQQRLHVARGRLRFTLEHSSSS